MSRFLDEILDAKRSEIESLRARAGADESPRSSVRRVFAAALKRPGLSLIAEIKRRSPSKGPLQPNLDAARLAADYERGGAAAISCLTDARFFGAHPDDLPAARAATMLPVLRKDFLIDATQIVESRRLGADAVLLIARILTDAQLRALREFAESLQMAAIIEVHDKPDIDRALSTGATIIGVNNRDLDTFLVERRTALRLRPCIPPGVLTVAESGLSTPDDLRAVADAGYDAVLIGESLVRHPHPSRAVNELLKAAGAARPVATAEENKP